MSLPESTKSVLLNNLKFCFTDNFNISEAEIIWFKANLNIVVEDSAFIDFYAIVAFPPKGKGEELYTLDSILEAKNNGFHEEEYPGIYERFLPLSSIEGEGSYFYDVITDRVYDTDWGEEILMMEGSLRKYWSSFYEFLEWYYSEKSK